MNKITFLLVFFVFGYAHAGAFVELPLTASFVRQTSNRTFTDCEYGKEIDLGPIKDLKPYQVLSVDRDGVVGERNYNEVKLAGDKLVLLASFTLVVEGTAELCPATSKIILLK